jgi:soluble lytic murein transglycosylase
MRASYEASARHATAYYGQLARAKLGLERLELRAPPADPASGPALSDEIVRAADMLYAIGERDVVVSLAVDLAEQCKEWQRWPRLAS